MILELRTSRRSVVKLWMDGERTTIIIGQIVIHASKAKDRRESSMPARAYFWLLANFAKLFPVIEMTRRNLLVKTGAALCGEPFPLVHATSFSFLLRLRRTVEHFPTKTIPTYFSSLTLDLQFLTLDGF